MDRCYYFNSNTKEIYFCSPEFDLTNLSAYQIKEIKFLLTMKENHEYDIIYLDDSINKNEIEIYNNKPLSFLLNDCKLKGTTISEFVFLMDGFECSNVYFEDLYIKANDVSVFKKLQKNLCFVSNDIVEDKLIINKDQQIWKYIVQENIKDFMLNHEQIWIDFIN